MSQLERYEKGGIGRWYWDYRDRQVMKYIRGQILDVGCGERITTRKMGAFGIDTTDGTGSVYSIPFPDDYFDCVTLIEVIEHLERPMAAIQEIRRVLKPGGRVIILFPNDRTFKIAWFLCGMWGEIGRKRGHLYQWRPLQMWAELYLTGHKIILQRSIPINWWPLALHHIIVGEKC